MMNIKALHSSKTLVNTYQFTLCNTLEDLNGQFVSNALLAKLFKNQIQE
jgi:hypothetical protein